MTGINSAAFARFWSNVAVTRDPSECWPWVGGEFQGRGGYGRFSVNGGGRRAHIVAYELANGPVPHGIMVRHACDNPPCCNPAHLLCGTAADNSRDRSARGRSADRRGALHPLARLDEAAIGEIRKLAEMGRRHADIASEFGISRQHVGKIARRENWSHV